jgi:hypothetical protein
MTTTTFKKHISYVTDTNGEQTAVQLDLKNKSMREFWEDMVDTMTAIERENEKPIPYEEFEKEYLADITQD